MIARAIVHVHVDYMLSLHYAAIAGNNALLSLVCIFVLLM